MKKTLIALAAISSMAAAGTVAAHDLSYNFVDANYQSFDFDNGGDADGFNLGVSGLITPNVYLFGDYSDFGDDDSDTDANILKAGAGFRSPISTRTDFVAGAAIAFVDLETPAANDDDTGFALNVGLRTLIQPQFELFGSVDYLDVDILGDSQTSLTGGGRFHITPQLDIGASYSVGDEVNTVTLGGRFNF